MSEPAAPRPLAYRPYRVALYAAHLTFTLTFIGLLIVSVWRYNGTRETPAWARDPAVCARAIDEYVSVIGESTRPLPLSEAFWEPCRWISESPAGLDPRWTGVRAALSAFQTQTSPPREQSKAAAEALQQALAAAGVSASLR